MADKKLDAMRDDIKLLKGEIKQSLASVRDYLLNMELPSSEIANILAALGNDGDKITMKGSLESVPDRGPARDPEPVGNPPDNALSNQEELFEMDEPAENSFAPQSIPSDQQAANPFTDEQYSDDAGTADQYDELSPSSSRQDNGDCSRPQPEKPVKPETGMNDYDDRYEDLAATREPLPYENPAPAPENSMPRVNMLANLINWVSRAKQEIGYEQLPMFLEVYGISGHLSPELKDIILHLAEITGDKPAASASAGVWSESMLTLHGILTGGEAPLHPVLPSWCSEPDITDQIDEDELMESEEEDPQDAPVKLKLVFPSSNGKSREFCIDLAPDQEENNEEPRRLRNRKGGER